MKTNSYKAFDNKMRKYISDVYHNEDKLWKWLNKRYTREYIAKHIRVVGYFI